MNPDLTNSASQANGTAANLDQPVIFAWLLSPIRIQASQFQLSGLAPSAIAPQVSLDYSHAAAVSQARSTSTTTVASKNSLSSSTRSNQQASSREQALVVRPTFSLADSHEGGLKLQNVNVPQTTFNDSHQFAPVISNVQTLGPDDFIASSINVSGPEVTSTQEPQICIESVFSLVDRHIEHHTGQHETENEVSHIAIDSSASPQTLPEHPALPRVYRQNKTISAEKEHDSVSCQFRTTKQNQYSAPCSALYSPVCLTSPLRSSNNIQETNILLHPVTTSKNNVSVEVSSPKDDSQQFLDCSASISRSAAYQRSTSAVTNDAQLPVSQKNSSMTEAEKKSTHVLRGEEMHEKPASLTKPQDSSSTLQKLSNAFKVQEPEIVDLDIENTDDCMLVNVDLSRYHFPYGSRIHNSEVVIGDSDNDEDVTVLTKETSLSSGETSNGKCGKQRSCAISTVVMGEHDPCGTTGSLSKEVEKINSEASKTDSEQAAMTYTVSSSGQTLVTSVMSTRTKTQPLSDQLYTKRSCSTWHTAEIENPESELIDLLIDDDDEYDDAAPSTVEYVSLTLLKPSQPDKNVSTPVIHSVFSSSSLLSSTSDIPTLKESYCNPFLEPAVQGQIIENLLRRSEVPLVSSHAGVRKDHTSQVNYSSEVAPTVPRHQSHHLPSDSSTGKITNYKCSLKASPKGKAINSTIPRPKGKSLESSTLNIKIPSAARTQKKSPSHGDIASKMVESALSAKIDSSIVCIFCFKSFSSVMELATHSWNCHRSSYFVENNLKCDECGECFANNSSLELHKKVKCISSNASDVDPVDSVLHTLLKENRVSRASEVSSSSATCREVVEPQPNTAGVSSGSAAIDFSNSTPVDVSIILNILPQRNEVISNYSTGLVTESATDTHPDFATGEKPMSEELMQEDIKPVVTSTCELPQRSDEPDQVLAGGHPSVSDGHKCTSCQKMFSKSLHLSLHQQVSEGCQVARNDCVRCFVCAKTFPSNIIRYLHMLNNPECKKKVDRYCNKCSHLFNSLADKQGHLRMFNACRIYEECITKDIVKNSLSKNMGHVEQNVAEPRNQLHPLFNACEISQPDKSPSLAQENNNSTQVTDSPIPNCVSYQASMPDSNILQQHSQINPAGKSHGEKPKGGEAMKQKPYVLAKSSAKCPECKKTLATSALLILHINESPKCWRKFCSSKFSKKISASEVVQKISESEVAKKISASDRVNVLKPLATSNSPGRASTDNVINSSSAAVTASRNVFCDISSTDRSLKCKVCGAEFISENELTHHTEQKCRKLQNSKALPQLKNLRVVLSCVSVMCQVCHLPFADDIRLAEHLHLNQPCHKGTSERIKRLLELKKSHVDIDTLKRDGKRRSCEIVTDISNVTSIISMASTQECIALTEQMSAMDNIIHEKLAKGNDGHISSNSSAKKQYVCDQGNANDESKGHADDSDKDELISSMSSLNEGSDMEESGSGSSSEEGDRDYTCKQCCKGYTSKSLLIKHSKSHHQSTHSKKTCCKVCTRKFHDLTGLQAHLLQFKFCFIPLTRPLWEQKQDPQSCSMCKKVIGSPKDLRKHCFKKMACRLRYINLVLKNMKEKNHASVPPAAEAETPVLKTVKEKENTTGVHATEAEIPVSKAGNETCEYQSVNEVSSSVPDYCNPLEVDSSNSDIDIEDETSCIKISNVVSKPLIECLNCNGVFDNFQEHLLKQQSCLDFFGIHANKCPVQVPFCYQCKTQFDDIGLLQLHACKGFVAYTHVCQTCGLKFTSAHNFHAHFQQSLTCSKTNLSSPQKNDHDGDRTFVDSSAKHQQGGMFAVSSAVRDVPTSPGQQFFHCLLCDAIFFTLRLLMEHSYQHVEETPISCDRCSITFLHYNQFVSHQAFHIRMDKEANILVEKPQLSTSGASTSTDNNVKAHVDSTSAYKTTRAQNSDSVTGNASTCIFCRRDFGSVKAKLVHLNSNHSCMALMRYIIENKVFVCDQGGTEPFDRRVTDSDLCEFCNQSFSYKFYHNLNSACFRRLESAILNCSWTLDDFQEHLLKYILSSIKKVSVVSQTEHKEPDTHRVLMKHEGEW